MRDETLILHCSIEQGLQPELRSSPAPPWSVNPPVYFGRSAPRNVKIAGKPAQCVMLSKRWKRKIRSRSKCQQQRKQKT